MSKLHVTQIEGFLKAKVGGLIDLSDCANHSDQAQLKKILLTRGLAALAASHMTEEPIEELSKSVTDGAQDGGIDLVYFNANERTLYLVQTKWHEDGHGSIELGDALKFIEGVKKVLDNDLSQLNERIRAKSPEIERALFDANANFVLVIAHTGQEELSSEVQNALNAYVASQNDTSDLMFLRVLKQGELHKAVAAGLAGAPVSAEVQLYGWGQTKEPHFAVYGQVCAADVAAWMKINGSRLFERNLRQFLGTSQVNQDIVDTLLTRPEDFWYFNNGITAVASGLAKKPIGGNSSESGIFECAGFCVVNGAQTVGSIFAAASQNPEAVQKAMVPVRIISSEKSPSTFASEVTRYTNTQNAIEKRDFVALDPEQERIRQELHIEGIDYAYKSGSSSGSTAKRFDLVEATVALACTHSDVSLAVQAKREIGKLWEDLSKAPYKQLFNSGVSGPMVWQAVQALRAVDQALSVEANKYGGRDSLVCVHGNRFIEWAALKTLGISSSQPFASVEAKVPEVVAATVACLVAAVKANYADSYPASLFKNLGKCKVIASKM
ncbi:AIPR family protein [Variovorax sp. J31P179]|uniref:AIPR family protein n=1 Tax=Variovorax sp. J31P179 TaxID=3053508 RepID=UPI002576C628|nr:AIPR family protein [Variovorax sp. J31P179]MDM0083160.1 AIPR family protein [Variovorax sp. J31P179]